MPHEGPSCPVTLSYQAKKVASQDLFLLDPESARVINGSRKVHPEQDLAGTILPP